MFSDWHRDSDYFAKIPGFCLSFSMRFASDLALNTVSFKNCAQVASVSGIKVLRCSRDKSVNLLIGATVFHENEIGDIVEHYFKESAIVYREGTFTGISFIEFKATDDIKSKMQQLIKMFHYINKKYKRVEISELLIKELCNILAWSFAPIPGLKAHPGHFIKEYISPVGLAHVNPLKQKSTAVLDLFKSQNTYTISPEYVAANLLRIRREIRYLISHGDDPNQCDSEGLTPLVLAILYLTPEDVAFLLWHNADPVLRPHDRSHRLISINYFGTDNAIEVTRRHNKLEHYDMIKYSYSRFKRNLSAPIQPLQVTSCKVFDVGNQIHSDVTFNNNESIKTRFMTIEEFQKNESEAVRAAVFSLFRIYFPDPSGNIEKDQQNFAAEFLKDHNVDIIFDKGGERVVGYVVLAFIEDKGTLVPKFRHMALSADSFLRNCGGVGLFGIRWACLTKNMYRENIVKTHHLACHYNSYAPMQDELITPKKLSKSMLEFNQRMTDKEIGRNVQIYYGRFVAVKELIKVMDKKDPNRQIGFDEFCYNLFALSFDDPTDEKKLAAELGTEPVKAAVVSSVVGAGFLRRRAQIFKTFLNFDLCQHIDELTPIMKRKANIFMPAFAKYKQTPVVSPLKFEDFGDERLAFWLGIQNLSKL